MKCQKCNAENINEAVKCGMCGTKLKHTTIFNNITGSQQVESSIRREQKPNSRQHQRTQNTSRPQQNPNNRPNSTSATSQQPTNLVETVLNTNLPVQEKARIFLDSWRTSNDQTNQPKKKRKWLFFIVFFFIFGLPIVKKVGTAIYDEVSYQIRERTRIANEGAAGAEVVQDESDVATAEAVPTLTPELEQEIIHAHQEIKNLQDAWDIYYSEHQRLPSKLSDLKSTEISTIDRNVFANTKILSSGVIVYTHANQPEIQLIYEPDSSDIDHVSWTCYSVGADIEEATGCALLPENPFVNE